jgi:hypothetical protein
VRFGGRIHPQERFFIDHLPTSRCLVLLALALPACAQTTLTGAIQFSTNNAGAYSGAQLWNTAGGDTVYDLWLAHKPDATFPVNGPSDAQAAINITLMANHNYRYYIFGAPGSSTGANGLNLFFDNNNSTPGISAYGPTNGTHFRADANKTLTLAGTPVRGSGHLSYTSGGVVVALVGYNWNTPATPPGDVCQPYDFAPGGGLSLYGSFTLRVSPAAALKLRGGTLTGSGFLPLDRHFHFEGYSRIVGC